MKNYVVKIVRYTSNYPIINPDSIVVGFNVTNKLNKSSYYKEIRIFFHEIKAFKSEDQISEYAWEKVKPFFFNWLHNNKKQCGNIIGKSFEI